MRFCSTSERRRGTKKREVYPVLRPASGRCLLSSRSGESQSRLGRGNFRGGDLLGSNVLDELWITRGTHFGDVQAGDFDFRRDAIATDQLADDIERHAADDHVPADADDDFDDLSDQ